jgi:hypothetical protein
LIQGSQNIVGKVIDLLQEFVKTFSLWWFVVLVNLAQAYEEIVLRGNASDERQIRLIQFSGLLHVKPCRLE